MWACDKQAGILWAGRATDDAACRTVRWRLNCLVAEAESPVAVPLVSLRHAIDESGGGRTPVRLPMPLQGGVRRLLPPEGPWGS